MFDCQDMRFKINRLLPRMVFTLLITTFLAVFPWSGESGALADNKRRVALVIGNERYADTSVPKAAEDARLLASALEEHGFDVVLGVNTSSHEFDILTRKFSVLAGGAELALIYYAGHSVALAGLNYLAPVDAPLRTRSDMVKMKWLADVIEAARGAKSQVLVLDTCWDNQLARGWGDRIGRGSICEDAKLTKQVERAKSVMMVLPKLTDSSASSRVLRGKSLYREMLVDSLKHSSRIDEILLRSSAAVRVESRSTISPLVIGSIDDQLLVSQESNDPTESEVTIDEKLLSELDSLRSESALANRQEDVTTSQPSDLIEEDALLAFVVQTIPSGANVRILNIEPVYRPGMLLRSGGAFQIEVSLDGYDTQTRWITLSEDTRLLEIDLVELDSPPNEPEQNSVSLNIELATEVDAQEGVKVETESINASDSISESDNKDVINGKPSIVDTSIEPEPVGIRPSVREITDADMQIAFGKFSKLASILKKADDEALKAYIPESPKRRLLEQLIQQYVSIESQIITITAITSRAEIAGVLRIGGMSRANGDLISPGESYRDIQVFSIYQDDEWSDPRL